MYHKSLTKLIKRDWLKQERAIIGQRNLLSDWLE